MARPDHCLNCDYPFSGEEHYCPQCGQSRREPLPKVKDLILDFLGDFFTFDSKLFRSVIPLFTHPGKMTLEYIEGKQVRFIPPLRMFIFLSVVMVLLLNYAISDNDWEIPIQFGGDLTISQIDSLITAGDSTLVDTVNQEAVRTYSEYRALREQGYSNREISDSLLPESSMIEKIVLQQALRIDESGGRAFTGYLVGNTTLFLFGLLFLLSSLLGIIFYRHRLPFMAHLIYSFHLHSFLVIVFMVVLILIMLSAAEVFLVLLPVSLLLYHVLALHHVYRKSWLPAILVGVGSYLIYLLVIIPITLGVLLVLSFLLF